MQTQDRGQAICDRGKLMQKFAKEIRKTNAGSAEDWLAYHVGTLKQRVDHLEDQIKLLTKRRANAKD